MRLRARVVGTRRQCMASLARNSRTDERSTARPSAPRQKGVCPPPFSCISQRREPAADANAGSASGWRLASGTTTSPMLTARPSP